MKIVWSRNARKDLEQVYGFMAETDAEAAHRTVRWLARSVEPLTITPWIGRPGRVIGTRELVLLAGPYVIAYRVRSRTVEVARVIHTSRRWPKRI